MLKNICCDVNDILSIIKNNEIFEKYFKSFYNNERQIFFKR